MTPDRAFEPVLRDRLQRDAARLAPRLQTRAAGSVAARRRGERRRRAARTALALCTVLAVTVVSATAWQLQRDPGNDTERRGPDPATTTTTTSTAVAVTEPSMTVLTGPPSTAAAPTIPPSTVLPDPTGAGAVPLEWTEVDGDVAGLGITGTTDDGTTYSLYDAGAAEPSSAAEPSGVRMAVARTSDGSSWEHVADVAWATDLITDGETVVLAGRAPFTGGRPKVRLATSDDGGRTWQAHDVELPDGVDAPVLNPFPGGTLPTPLVVPPPTGPVTTPPGQPSTATSTPEEPRYGTWILPWDQSSTPRLAAGPAGIIAVVGGERSEVGDAIPRCTGDRDAATTYWYEYRDGIIAQVRPFTGGFPSTFEATVVPAASPPPPNLVRCTVNIDAAAVTAATTISTTVLRHQDGRWSTLDSDLPDGTGWRAVAMGDHFVAEALPDPSGQVAVPHLRSSDGAHWAPFSPPGGWPLLLGTGSDATDGPRAIGSDRDHQQVATSTDGGSSWIRIDLRHLPVPNGPERPTTVSVGEARTGPLGFVIRYTAAEGSRFWRILATSADGRTWATFDESPTMWTGPLGPRLALAGDAYLMTTNDSAPIGGVPTDGSPMVIGFTTRNYVGRPV